MKYCSRCGEQSPDNARFCTRCGYEMPVPENVQPATTPSALPNQPGSFRHANQMPPTYLWQAIVVTILCCLPLGIPAIVYSSQVERKYLQGDIAGAELASRYAKNFSIWSFVLGIVGCIAIMVFYGSLIVAALNGAYIE